MMILFRSFLSIKIMFRLLASITLSHWTLISHNTFTSSFSTPILGRVQTIYLYVLTYSSQKDPSGLSLVDCRVVSYIPSEFNPHIHLVSVAHFHLFVQIIYIGSFHWFYWCGALHSLSWWPVPVQHITTLLPQSVNPFWITITKFYPYQLWQIVHVFSFRASSG